MAVNEPRTAAAFAAAAATATPLGAVWVSTILNGFSGRDFVWRRRSFEEELRERDWDRWRMPKRT